MFELFVAVLASLFTVVNPLGAVPVFLAMTPTASQPERRRTAFYTGIYFTLILLSFFFGGTMILSFFGISISAMRIAGGLVILLSGYGLLSGNFAENRAISTRVKEEAIRKDDISFSPLAMPLLSGPGSISLLISLYAEHPEVMQKAVISSVILVMGGIVYLILLFAPFLNRILGEAGLRAMTRIMGFIVMAIGVQYVIGGIVHLVKVMV